jgi:hypothetical protein
MVSDVRTLTRDFALLRLGVDAGTHNISMSLNEILFSEGIVDTDARGSGCGRWEIYREDESMISFCGVD